MRRGEKTPDDLDRPEGNGLKANYEKHDVGHAELVETLGEEGFDIVEWGIDRRDDDGEDGIIYDDKMDFKVLRDDELVGLVDVKTKGSPRYMGRFNQRHYKHYYQHAEEFEVPTFVVMYQVDYKTNTVHDGFTFELGIDELYERVETSDDDAVPQFPDGNNAVLVPHDYRDGFGLFISRLKQQYIRNKEEDYD